MEKLTLEELHKIKEEIVALQEEISAFEEAHEGEEGFDIKVEGQPFIERYYRILDRILNHDLSDIPSEEWDNVFLDPDDGHMIDLTGTHANLDFTIIDNQEHMICKGCNVESLGTRHSFLDEDNYDPEAIALDPARFLPKLSNDEVRRHILNKELTMEELYSLPAEEVYMLRSKALELGFPAKEKEFIDALTANRAMDLYALSQSDYNYVRSLYGSQINYVHTPAYRDRLDFNKAIKECKIEDIVKTIESFIRRMILELRHNSLDPNDYPGMCYSCEHYDDYGPVAGRFNDYNGKCKYDGHETDALVKCKINQYKKSNYEE